jgi:hypothetical protein
VSELGRDPVNPQALVTRKGSGRLPMSQDGRTQLRTTSFLLSSMENSKGTYLEQCLSAGIAR